METERNQKEVKLNRALEDIEKYKTTLKETKGGEKDANQQARKETDKLLADIKRLEKQKNELLFAFKKQLKLIDVLKRQKVDSFCV